MITRKSEQTTERRDQMRGGEGYAALRALAAPLPKNLRLFSELRLKPGHSIGYHVHENETELFYFIEGSGKVQDDEEWVEIATGDVMTTHAGHGHAVMNSGAVDLVFVAVIVKE